VILKLASYRYTGGAAARVGVVEETTIADLTDLIGARGSVEALLALEPKSLRSLVAQAKQRRRSASPDAYTRATGVMAEAAKHLSRAEVEERVKALIEGDAYGISVLTNAAATGCGEGAKLDKPLMRGDCPSERERRHMRV
jgi:hypothetical protein